MNQSEENLANEAFVSALTQSQSTLRGYCYAALGHSEEAKEALQRVNIVLWKKSSDWDPSTEFLRWATKVAKFEVLGVIRDRKREREKLVFDTDVVEQMVESAETIATSNSDIEVALDSCLQKVSPQNRSILYAFYTKGHTIKEISEMHNKGLSAMKVLLMRLRRSLRKCIETQIANEGTK